MSEYTSFPVRLIRRGHIDRIKRRAARQMLRWSGRRSVWQKSSGTNGVKYYTVQEMYRNVGRLAAMHCTHICGMCKHEKKFDMPHFKASESHRIFDLIA